MSLRLVHETFLVVPIQNLGHFFRRTRMVRRTRPEGFYLLPRIIDGGSNFFRRLRILYPVFIPTLIFIFSRSVTGFFSRHFLLLVSRIIPLRGTIMIRFLREPIPL